MIGKCLFPVAGYGTRFLPATKSMPKEMLPIVNKPLVQYGVEEAIEAGMTNCALVTGRGKRAIADHFDISYELEHRSPGQPRKLILRVSVTSSTRVCLPWCASEKCLVSVMQS